MSIPGFNDKRVKEWARYAVHQGWRVETTGKGHVRWVPPIGCVIYSGLTSNSSGWKNLEAMLRRAGLTGGPLAKKQQKVKVAA